MSRKLLQLFALGLNVCSVGVVVVGAFGRPSARGDNPFPTLPPEKQAAVDHEQALRQQAGTPGPNATMEIPTVSPWTSPWPPHSPSGIIQLGDLAIQGNPYSFENHWQDVFQGNNFRVYAGALSADPSQGLLYVFAFAPDLRPLPDQFGIYPTPSKVGSIHIVDVSNGILTVASTNGALMTFDLTSRAWGSSQITAVPTPVLQPTDTPFATPAG
jgi:hypothetical protein